MVAVHKMTLTLVGKFALNRVGCAQNKILQAVEVHSVEHI